MQANTAEQWSETPGARLLADLTKWEITQIQWATRRTDGISVRNMSSVRGVPCRARSNQLAVPHDVRLGVEWAQRTPTETGALATRRMDTATLRRSTIVHREHISGCFAVFKW